MCNQIIVYIYNSVSRNLIIFQTYTITRKFLQQFKNQLI